MPNRWIIFVKKWASDNNFSFGCALGKPELKAAYNREYPKINKLPKGVAKLQESRPSADVKSKMTFPNLKIVTQPQEEEQENIQFDIVEEMDEPARRKRGRPQKHMTDEEKYKAKLESNKQKRRERAAAKKVKGGMMTANNDAERRRQIKHGISNLKVEVQQISQNGEPITQEEERRLNELRFDTAGHLSRLESPSPQEQNVRKLILEVSPSSPEYHMALLKLLKEY